MAEYTVTCQNCGKTFNRVRSATMGAPKFCSRACYIEHKKAGGHQERVCANCGKTFTIKSKNANHGRGKFCSVECYQEYRRKTAATADNPHFRGEQRVCQGCGKTFLRSASAIANGYGSYCSMECRKKERIELTCEFCGAKFYKLPCQVAPEGYGRFCSQSCRSKYTVRQFYTMSPTSIERLLMDAFAARGLEPACQYPMLNYVLDFAFPEYQLAVEADGVYWHSLPQMIAKDARKDAALSAEGWTVLHFTGNEIRASASACIDQVAACLAVSV